MRKTLLFTSCLLVILVLVISGCSSGNEPNRSDKFTSSVQPQDKPVQTIQTDHDATAPAVSDNTVKINEFSFNPGVLTVKQGATVTWTNEDSAPHAIKADAFTSPSMSKGGSFSYKFDNKGRFSYICSIHPSMKGEIVVE